MTCSICEVHNNSDFRSLYEIARTSLWVLRHHSDPTPLKGWLILDSIRHLSGPVDFLPDEASNWGIAVQKASNLIKDLTGCDRVYSIAFGEGAHHLHLHLIPRFQNDLRTESWKVADLYRSISSIKNTSLPSEAVLQIVEKAREIYPSFDMGS